MISRDVLDRSVKLIVEVSEPPVVGTLNVCLIKWSSSSCRTEGSVTTSS